MKLLNRSTSALLSLNFLPKLVEEKPEITHHLVRMTNVEAINKMKEVINNEDRVY